MTTLRDRARKLCQIRGPLRYLGGDCPSCAAALAALEAVRREDCAAMCELCAKGNPVHKCDCGQCAGWVHDDELETECVASAIHDLDQPSQTCEE